MPLYVAFIWHMHQPYYKDPLTGEYLLPWVRLHAVKDYLHMAEVLAQYPRIHVTVNVVPSLAVQLLEYARGEAVDAAMRLGLKGNWTAEEKRYMLENFFSINHEKILNRYPRYRKLLELKSQALSAPELFSNTYYRDLVTWFNLAWVDPNKLENDPTLRALVEKGARYTRRDFEKLMEKHREMTSRIVPLYRELEAKGQIELSTSPFYHPILPLLINVENARRPSPGLPLPSMPFAHPEDAEEQIRRAVEFHRSVFGRPPRGMWPSEGAVCRELIPIAARQGLRWLATDESILARSLGIAISRDEYGNLTDPRPLCRPYRVNANGRSVYVLFRERVLSDRIGFVYQHMPGKDAAEDLVSRLHLIRRRLNDDAHPCLVTVILDGENCWEYYEHNGDVFLHHLYGLLSEDPQIRCVTVSEYLEEFPDQPELPSLATGSWIGGNLETWIGEEAQNRAWDALARVRQDLVNWQNSFPLADVNVLDKAWESLYIAEGSDWFWWYYSRNVSAQEELFDRAFRGHLAGVYVALGLPVPEWLTVPITGPKPLEERAPTGFVSPRIDASPQASAEWAKAGYVQAGMGGAMRRGRQILRGLFYGYDPGSLYLRLEAQEELEDCSVILYLTTPRAGKVNWQFLNVDETVDVLNGVGLSWALEFPPRRNRAVLLKAYGQEVWKPAGEIHQVARSRHVLEAAVPLGMLDIKPGDTVSIMATVVEGARVVEKLPDYGPLTFTLRNWDYEAQE